MGITVSQKAKRPKFESLYSCRLLVSIRVTFSKVTPSQHK